MKVFNYLLKALQFTATVISVVVTGISIVAEKIATFFVEHPHKFTAVVCCIYLAIGGAFLFVWWGVAMLAIAEYAPSLVGI